MNHTLSAIKLDPNAVVLNLIDAMHIKRHVIYIASMGFSTTACGSNFIADNVWFTVYKSNFARSMKTAVLYCIVIAVQEGITAAVCCVWHSMEASAPLVLHYMYYLTL